MEEIRFRLKAAPFSINKAYYKNRKRTRECREWGDDILLQLQSSKILSKLRKVKQWKAIELHLLYHYPKEKLYTKKGEISRRSMDLSNIEKLLIDLICDSRYNGRVLKDTVLENANVDDKLIVKLVSEKRLSEDNSHYIDVIFLSV